MTTELQKSAALFDLAKIPGPQNDFQEIADRDTVLEGEMIATGGFMLHYNVPFADLHLKVKENLRRKTFGSFILQELKRVCYLADRVPAARCHLQNQAAREALLKAA